MNLHEYQSKQLFARYGIPVPAGHVASTPEEAVDAAQRLGGAVWVVKAQVHAGGRGKAGGVKVVKSIADVKSAAAGMLDFASQRCKNGQAAGFFSVRVKHDCPVKKRTPVNWLQHGIANRHGADSRIERNGAGRISLPGETELLLPGQKRLSLHAPIAVRTP